MGDIPTLVKKDLVDLGSRDAENYEGTVMNQHCIVKILLRYWSWDRRAKWREEKQWKRSQYIVNQQQQQEVTVGGEVQQDSGGVL